MQTNQATARRHLKSDGYMMYPNLFLNTGYRENTSATYLLIGSHNVGKDSSSRELSGALDIVVLWFLTLISAPKSLIYNGPTVL